MATKVAFALFPAANIAVWSLLGWIGADDAVRGERSVSVLVPLLLPAAAVVACLASVRFKRYDWGGFFAFVMLFAALPFAIVLDGGM